MTKHADRILAQYKEDLADEMLVATLECASGNSEVGNMWIETATFSTSDPLIDVMAWAKLRGHGGQGAGRLMLTVAQPNPCFDLNPQIWQRTGAIIE